MSCFCSTARLRGVHDGLFTGQIDAVDTSAATYRVTFDRSGLGTHTVPDYEVLVRFACCLPKMHVNNFSLSVFYFSKLSTHQNYNAVSLKIVKQDVVKIQGCTVASDTSLNICFPE